MCTVFPPTSHGDGTHQIHPKYKSIYQSLCVDAWKILRRQYMATPLFVQIFETVYVMDHVDRTNAYGVPGVDMGQKGDHTRLEIQEPHALLPRLATPVLPDAHQWTQLYGFVR
mmetsp:Transcript_68730/g.102164  ORF Transcript_68730/g.102164 Transcript_68730/m.102164 type:complete len:113 (-) Transcript_68730:288-626(-)